jgi:hypothetical protein
MRRCALCLILSLFCLAWIRPPGPSLIVETTSYAESLIQNPQITVMVVKVLRAGIVKGTNAAPPEGEFRVVQVLRGRYVPPGDYRYKVSLHRLSTEDAAVWDSTPVHGPVPGDGLIVFAYVGSQPVAEGDIIPLQGPMIRDIPSLRTRVIESLEHDSKLQFPLFLLILASPALGFFRRFGWLSIPLAFGAYRVYENSMSSAYDIRVDLLLIWPALIASVVVPLVAHAWRRRRQVGKGLQ